MDASVRLKYFTQTFYIHRLARARLIEKDEA